MWSRCSETKLVGNITRAPSGATVRVTWGMRSRRQGDSQGGEFLASEHAARGMTTQGRFASSAGCPLLALRFRSRFASSLRGRRAKAGPADNRPPSADIPEAPDRSDRLANGARIFQSGGAPTGRLLVGSGSLEVWPGSQTRPRPDRVHAP